MRENDQSVMFSVTYMSSSKIRGMHEPSSVIFTTAIGGIFLCLA